MEPMGTSIHIRLASCSEESVGICRPRRISDFYRRWSVQSATLVGTPLYLSLRTPASVIRYYSNRRRSSTTFGIFETFIATPKPSVAKGVCIHLEKAGADCCCQEV